MFAIFLELIQHQINPNRTFDVIDLLANCIGVVVGTLIAVKQSILKLK
jgi:VanZ family protein